MLLSASRMLATDCYGTVTPRLPLAQSADGRRFGGTLRYDSMTMAPDAPTPPGPRSPWELFRVFNGLALRGFGGVLPWAQRVLVEETRWLGRDEFVALLSLAQVLPGPNVCNLALMVGDRFFGLRGALAALTGMLAVPLVIVMTLALLYGSVSDHPLVSSALRGMGAASAGMILAMALKLLPSQRDNRPGWLFVAAAFVMIGLLRWPLVWVMPGLGLASVLIARARRPR